METLSKIEKNLVKNQERLCEIKYIIRENLDPQCDEDFKHETEEIKERNSILEIKRSHLLDRRNGWIARIIWSIIAPIIISVITTWLIYYFNLK